MRRIIDAGRILHYQYGRLAPATRGGGLIVRAEQFLQSHLRMIEQAMGGLGFGPATTGLWQAGRGLCGTITADGNHPLVQTLIPQ